MPLPPAGCAALHVSLGSRAHRHPPAPCCPRWPGRRVPISSAPASAPGAASGLWTCGVTTGEAGERHRPQPAGGRTWLVLRLLPPTERQPFICASEATERVPPSRGVLSSQSAPAPWATSARLAPHRLGLPGPVPPHVTQSPHQSRTDTHGVLSGVVLDPQMGLTRAAAP